MSNGALYVRVSTDKQEELSPDAQKRLLLDYAEKNNIIINENFIFTENGISGKRADKRPEFQKMIAIAKSKEHPIDVILVWKFSRFARNQEESIVYKSLLKKNNVEVISVSEPLIEGPFGSLIERIIEWMDEYYSIRLSGEVFRGMSENAMRGKYQCSSPLGYKMKDGIPEIVDDEAIIIKKIFDMYTYENKSLYSIANDLNVMGYKTKKGGDFERRSIEYIIKNPLYYGMIRWNYAENGSKNIKDKSQWIISKGLHKPIISEEQWKAANNRFNLEYKPTNHKPSKTYKHWLSGMVKCSACKATLSTSVSNGYMYFQCYRYRKGKCKVSHQISSIKLEKAVLSSLKEILAIIEDNSDIVYEKIPTHTSPYSNTDYIYKELDKINIKEKRLKKAYMEGIDTLEEYKTNKEIIQKEREIFLQQLETYKNDVSTDSKELLLEEVKNAFTILESDKVPIEYKSELIKHFIKDITFNKHDNSLDINIFLNP